MTRVPFIISEDWVGPVGVAAELSPGAQWQHCVAHFYRNVFSNVPKDKGA